MTLGLLFSWILIIVNGGKTLARNGNRRTLQTPCKCLTNVANASECLTNVTNGLWMLTNIDGEWQHSQHSLKFRRRFLNWPLFVRRWRMTCERSEFFTNAYKHSASVANFGRMSNIFFRKHIRTKSNLLWAWSLLFLIIIEHFSAGVQSKQNIPQRLWNLSR